MTSTKLTAAALSLSVMLSVASPVFAQGEPRENWQQFKQEFKDGQYGQARRDLRCTEVTARINRRINDFNVRKEHHIAQYQRIKTRVQNLINKLDGKGYDTSKVKSDLETLDGKIQKASTDYATFISKLEATRQYDCADANGQFVQAMKDAKAALATVHADVKDIRDFIHNTIVPDIKALKGQKPAVTPAS